MKRTYSRELKEVRGFLDTSNRREKFIRLQKDLKVFFQDLGSNPSCPGQICNVFSRADINPSNPIKTEKKIAIKLYKWRKNPKDPQHYGPSDIHDIAGLTLVCPYPSDVQAIVAHLRSMEKKPTFELDNFRYIDPIKSGGYSAYHGVYSGRGSLRSARCEVQIKTVLTQAWGVKTHDLTYKPSGDIDPRLIQTMEKLSAGLLNLDAHSEILKEQITDSWKLDHKRRHAASVSMIIELKESDFKATKTLFDFWSANETELAYADLSDDIPLKFEEMIDDYKSKHGVGDDFCRVVCLYALSRHHDDQNDLVLDTVDEWLDHVEYSGAGQDSVDYFGAMVFRSLSAMSLGEYSEAIESGRWLLENSEKFTLRHKLAAVSNLAYVLSEAYYYRYFDEPEGGGRLDRSGSDSCRIEAIKLLKEIDLNFEGITETQILAVKDTIGSVKICCSQTEEDVKKGLKLCREAYEKSKILLPVDEHSAVDAYFDLHEKRAFRRILTLSS